MLDKIPKQDKERFTIYIPPEVIRIIKQRALDQTKTLSKYIADLVTGEGER